MNNAGMSIFSAASPGCISNKSYPILFSIEPEIILIPMVSRIPGRLKFFEAYSLTTVDSSLNGESRIMLVTFSAFFSTCKIAVTAPMDLPHSDIGPMG